MALGNHSSRKNVDFVDNPKCGDKFEIDKQTERIFMTEISNPLFSRQGVPIRFPVGVLHRIEECHLIRDVASKVLEKHGGIGHLTHIWVDWNGEQQVVELHAFSVANAPQQAIIGTFEFSDMKKRPLFLRRVDD